MRYGTFARRVTTAGFVAALLGGCTAVNARHDFDRTPQAGTELVIRNQTFDQLAIYLVRGGTRIRIGSVPGFSTHTLRLSRTLAGQGSDLRLVARPLGSRYTIGSDEFGIIDGASLAWTVGTSAASTFLVQR
jgi:hypothetical protein